MVNVAPPLARYDVLVIGSGAAGLGLALSLAARYRVAVLCKEDLLESSSQYAQGGIAAVMEESEDSYDSHIADTLRCGAGLCDPVVVEHTVKHAKAAIDWLVAHGVQFTTTADQRFHLTQEGGHSHRRILHAADKTGAAVVKTLADQITEHPNIDTFTEHTSIDLLLAQGRCVGALALNNRSGETLELQATVTVLATGGASRAYLHTSNPGFTTGDGVAIAYRAGARVADMEFNQFHPTCLYNPEGETFLITEAMRGEGARLRLPNGEAFMARYDTRAELAPRDIVARAIDHELKSKHLDYVLLDISHQNPDVIRRAFPTIAAFCLTQGIDITRQPIPVVPAAHYSCGGVVTNLHGETDIPGLLAIGEVACTGLHGANRMASNSLLECLVFAKNAAQFIQQHITPRALTATAAAAYQPARGTVPDTALVSRFTQAVRKLVWDYVGIVRHYAELPAAAAALASLRNEVTPWLAQWQHTKSTVELRNLLLIAQLIIEGAQTRPESRGIHYLVDKPAAADTAYHTILAKDQPAHHSAYIHNLIPSE